MEAEIDAAGKRNAELDALLAAATLKATTVEADLETHKADMAEAVEEIEASTKRIEELEDDEVDALLGIQQYCQGEKVARGGDGKDGGRVRGGSGGAEGPFGRE